MHSAFRNLGKRCEDVQWLVIRAYSTPSNTRLQSINKQVTECFSGEVFVLLECRICSVRFVRSSKCYETEICRRNFELNEVGSSLPGQKIPQKNRFCLHAPAEHKAFCRSLKWHTVCRRK